MLFQTRDGIDYIVLTDFGTSKYSLSTEKYDTDQGLFSGTVQFNSPERFKGEMNKEKEDVWALGVSLYLLSSFALPFDAENKFNLAIISKITDPAISHQKIENRSKELNELIDSLLNKDHEKRPSIKELFLNYPIVQTAVCDLLKKFVPIKNIIFEELILRL